MADVETRRPVALRTLPGVELAAAGTWRASTGETTFTVADLANAVAALDCPGVRNPVLKLGHDEEDSTGGVRWDGEPAVGWIANMRLSDSGVKLLGDYTGVPDWLAEVMPSAYPDRSIEIYRPFRCQIGHEHPSVITAVALLGVSRPGVGVLQSLQDVYAAFTVTDGQNKADATAHVQAVVPVRLTARRPAVVLSREPNAAELAAGTDFERMQTQWEDRLDDLLADWPEVTAEQRDDLTAQVRDAVDAGATDRLGNLTVD